MRLAPPLQKGLELNSPEAACPASLPNLLLAPVSHFYESSIILPFSPHPGCSITIVEQQIFFPSFF